MSFVAKPSSENANYTLERGESVNEIRDMGRVHSSKEKKGVRKTSLIGPGEEEEVVGVERRELWRRKKKKNEKLVRRLRRSGRGEGWL